MTLDLVQIDQESRDLLASIDAGWEAISSGMGQVVSATTEVVSAVRTAAQWIKAIYDKLPELKPNKTVESIGDRVLDAMLKNTPLGGFESIRGYGFDVQRERNKMQHPEWFSTGTH